MTPSAGRPPVQTRPPPPPMSPDPEGLADMTFPVRGVDVAHAHSRQPPMTTPVGTNVRGFEPATNRARGGSRPGLSKYIAEQIPNWSQGHPFQHLNYIVDPRGEATLNNVDYQLGDFTTLDEFGFGDGDFFYDPSLGDTWRIAGHGGFIRVGGHLKQHSQPKLKSPRILWSNPADMTVGDFLGGTQLNAQAVDPQTGATVSGTFTYDPVASTLMDVVGTFDLSVVFTPDSVHIYRPAARSVSVNVLPRALTVTAVDQDKLEGTDFVFTGSEFTTTGLHAPDSVTSCTLASAGSPSSAAEGTYPITVSAAQGTGLSKYTISYVPGTMTVGAGEPFVAPLEVQTADIAIPASARTLTFATPVLAGDLIVVFGASAQAALGGAPAVTDSAGNTYAQGAFNPSPDTGSGVNVLSAFWTQAAGPSASLTATLTPDGADLDNWAVALLYRPGGATGIVGSASGQIGNPAGTLDPVNAGPSPSVPGGGLAVYAVQGSPNAALPAAGTNLRGATSDLVLVALDVLPAGTGAQTAVLGTGGGAGNDVVLWAVLVFGPGA